MSLFIEIELQHVAAAMIVCYLIYYFWKASFKPGYPIRTVRGYPLLGVALDLVAERILPTFRKFSSIYGKVYQLYALQTRYIVISDVSLVREILQKRPKTFRRTRKMEEPLATIHGSDGLFGAEGNLWAKLRRHNSPSFSKQNVELMLGAMFDEANQLMERLKDQCAEKAEASSVCVDIDKELSLFIIEVLVRLSLGNASGEAKDYLHSEQFRLDLMLQFKYVAERLLFPFPRYLWKLTPMFKLETEAIRLSKILTTHCESVIQQARQSSGEDCPSDGSLMSHLIREDNSINDRGLSNDEILSAVVTFLVAGSETNTTTASWMPYFLIMNPDALHRMREEVDGFFAAYGDDVKRHIQEFVQLPFCTAVVKETLRLAGPVPFLLIQTTDNSSTAELSNGLPIEPKDEIVLDFEACCLDEEVFSSAKSFLPSRWLTHDSKQLELMNASFLVFGGGSRTCPGIWNCYTPPLPAISKCEIF